MISEKVKLLCLPALMLAISGCSNSGSDDITDTQPFFDDTASLELIEATASTDTSDGTATPVASVSSGQMDAYVDNPLVTAIPTEIKDDTSNASTGNYITNPLIN